MKLPEFETTILRSTNFTVIVENAVGEYMTPKMEGITTWHSWDAYVVENILRWEHPYKEPGEIDVIFNKVFQGWLDEAKESDSYLVLADREPRSHYEAITFWAQEDGFETVVRDYLTHFKGYLEELWGKRGADDDYYDYLPSITDIFYALCEFFRAPERWERFKDWLVSREGEEVLEEALYRY